SRRPSCLGLILVSPRQLGRLDVGGLPALAVLGAAAGLTRRHRVGPWRLEASATTPAFVLAARLLQGPAPALAVATVAYAAEAWRGGSGRPSPLGSFLVEVGAVLASAQAARRLGPVALGGPAAEM